MLCLPKGTKILSPFGERRSDFEFLATLAGFAGPSLPYRYGIGSERAARTEPRTRFRLWASVSSGVALELALDAKTTSR